MQKRRKIQNSLISHESEFQLKTFHFISCPFRDDLTYEGLLATREPGRLGGFDAKKKTAERKNSQNK